MDHATHLPLVTLSEEEELFRTMVREFAEEQVKPHVMEMDRAAKIPQAMISQLFDLGVMGIEIPASYGGAGSSFFMSILAIEEFARIDPAIATCVDVQNTLVNNALVRCSILTKKPNFFPVWQRTRLGPILCPRPVPGATPLPCRPVPGRMATPLC